MKILKLRKYADGWIKRGGVAPIQPDEPAKPSFREDVEASVPDERPIELGYCKKCIQMTNHRNGTLVATCMKCGNICEPIDKLSSSNTVSSRTRIDTADGVKGAKSNEVSSEKVFVCKLDAEDLVRLLQGRIMTMCGGKVEISIDL